MEKGKSLRAIKVTDLYITEDKRGFVVNDRRSENLQQAFNTRNQAIKFQNNRLIHLTR